MSELRGRRDRHDLIAAILEAARDGVIKTHLMFRAKLSFAQLDEYVTLLVEKGFLEMHTVIKKKKTQFIFKTSELGEAFIKNFRALNL